MRTSYVGPHPRAAGFGRVAHDPVAANPGRPAMRTSYSGSPKVNTTLPAAMVTYCCPSTA